MGRREDRRQQRQVGHPVGPVLVGLAALVLHHISLEIEPLLVQRVEEEAHPVGLQPQHQLQVVGRDVGPVVGPVRSGRAVYEGANLLERLEVAAVVVLGALEHKVLEQVGKAGPPLLFVLGADVVPDVNGDHRQRVVLVQDDVEAVGQRELFVGDADHRNLRQGAIGGPRGRGRRSDYSTPTRTGPRERRRLGHRPSVTATAKWSEARLSMSGEVRGLQVGAGPDVVDAPPGTVPRGR